MAKMWAGRTDGATEQIADDFNSSIHFDSRMYRQDITGSMAHAAMLAACGFICLFSGILSVCRKLVTDTAAFSVVSCLLEITNGCFYASGQFSLPVIAAFCGFGGLCVHLQIFAVADFRIDIFNFYLFRIIHSVLSFFICKTVLHFFPVESSVFLSVSENIALWSFSPLSAISLLFLSLLLIFDLDNNRKIFYHSTAKELT